MEIGIRLAVGAARISVLCCIYAGCMLVQCKCVVLCCAVQFYATGNVTMLPVS